MAQLQGYAYMLLSTFSFTVCAAVSKAIGARASASEKVFWRSALSIAFTLLQHLGGSAPSASWPRRPQLRVLRGLCGHIALLAYFEALERLPLAEASVLGKIHPLAAAVFAWRFMGEDLPLARVAAILASLCGVALIAMPSGGLAAGGDPTGVALALFAGVLSGAAYCCVRALGRSGETELWMLLSFPLFSVPCTVAEAYRGLAGRGVDAGLLLWFLALGVATQAGQVFLARGLRILPAASGTQLMYVGCFMGVILGALMGDGWPRAQAWIGGAVICVASAGGEWRRPARASEGEEEDDAVEQPAAQPGKEAKGEGAVRRRGSAVESPVKDRALGS